MSKIISVGEFIGDYGTESSGLTHKSNIKLFLQSIYPEITSKELLRTLDEVSIRFVEEIKSGKRDLDNTVSNYSKQITHLAPTSRKMRFSSINLFFKINGLTVNPERWRIITKTGKKAGGKAISEEHIPDRVELSKILNHLPLHGKTVALILASSGMRPAEPFKLEMSQIEGLLKDRPMRIDLRAEQTKTAQARYVFISDEAKGFLIEWLEYREQFKINIQNKARKLKKPKEDLSDRVFPFTLGNFRFLWNGALKKTGLHKQDKVTKRITSPPKILRKFFRTRANWSNPEIAEFLMGHIGGSMGRINGRNDLVQVYARYEHTPDIVREVYIEAEPNLTILGSTPELYELREETAELRDIAQSKGEEILEKSDLVKYMRRDIEKLKSDNKDLREMVLGLNTLVTELDKQMNEFRDSYQTE